MVVVVYLLILLLLGLVWLFVVAVCGFLAVI